MFNINISPELKCVSVVAKGFKTTSGMINGKECVLSLFVSCICDIRL
jgi:hypothetical protein